MQKARNITFQYLDSLPDGAEFSGGSLAAYVNHRSGEYHYPDTALRYLRAYRKQRHREIECISKARSLYRIKGAA